MAETTTQAGRPATPPTYIGSLDGLRFFAFALVFIHHSTVFAEVPVLKVINRFGWVGVDLFFTISSFLFFYLFDAEMKKAGRIDPAKFYMRRLLRIYPLMIVFPLVMLLIFGSPDGLGIYRFLGLAVFVDNFASWISSYNTSIPYTMHLWTLSFEFQIYLAIPFLYLVYRQLGQAAFLKLLAGIFLMGFLARMAFVGLGAEHPVVWVTPFLRPESVLAGLALAVLRPTWRWEYSVVAAVVAAAVFVSMRVPWASASASAFSYPVAAIMCGALVDSAMRAPPVRRALAWEPVRWLGVISFGLYVYHLLAIGLAVMLLTKLGVPADVLKASGWALALAITVVLSAVSYRFLERPFLLLKERVTVVASRPV